MPVITRKSVVALSTAAVTYTHKTAQRANGHDQYRTHVRCSVVNMSKSCCFAVVLAVICLSVILLSLEADAQPTVDETMTCNAQEIKEEIRHLKIQLVSVSVGTNETCGLGDVKAVNSFYIFCIFQENIFFAFFVLKTFLYPMWDRYNYIITLHVNLQSLL